MIDHIIGEFSLSMVISRTASARYLKQLLRIVHSLVIKWGSSMEYCSCRRGTGDYLTLLTSVNPTKASSENFMPLHYIDGCSI